MLGLPLWAAVPLLIAAWLCAGLAAAPLIGQMLASHGQPQAPPAICVVSRDDPRVGTMSSAAEDPAWHGQDPGGWDLGELRDLAAECRQFFRYDLTDPAATATLAAAGEGGGFASPAGERLAARHPGCPDCASGLHDHPPAPEGVHPAVAWADSEWRAVLEKCGMEQPS